MFELIEGGREANGAPRTVNMLSPHAWIGVGSGRFVLEVMGAGHAIVEPTGGNGKLTVC